MKEDSREIKAIDNDLAEVVVKVTGKVPYSLATEIPQLNFDVVCEDECDKDCCCGHCGCCDEGDNRAVEKLPTPRFGGAFYNVMGEFIYIDKVVYNKEKGTVAVVWNDGVVTKATCDARDTWNPELGLALAVMKKLTDQDFVKTLLNDWVVEGATNQIRTLRDVRRDSKKKSRNEVVEEVVAPIVEEEKPKRGRPRKQDNK